VRKKNAHTLTRSTMTDFDVTRNGTRSRTRLLGWCGRLTAGLLLAMGCACPWAAVWAAENSAPPVTTTVPNPAIPPLGSQGTSETGAQLNAATKTADSSGGITVTTNTNTIPIHDKKPEAQIDADQVLRGYLRLQEQVHATLLAIERSRIEARLELRTNTAALDSRITSFEESFEKSLAEQRLERARSDQASNQTLIVLACSIVGLGLLAMAFAALFQSRGLNRLSDVATGLSHERSFLPDDLHTTESNNDRSRDRDRLLLAAGSEQHTAQNLITTIEKLEGRIRGLEGSALSHPTDLGVNEAETDVEFVGDRKSNGHPDQRPADHITVLLGKGQVLMSLGQVDNALACFEEAVAQAPNHAEAHLKKGMALERLKRLEEAIAAYDQTIALEGSLTQAYLSKGAVYNQQERYGEALECYEAALRSEKRV
jgi:tetratricopeptide (TPR) repeat protein